MLVTLLGMVMEVRPVQPSNALPPILVTLLGMIVFLHPVIRVFVLVSIMALQLSLESYLLLSASTLMEVKEQYLYLQLIVFQMVLIKTVEK